MLRGGRPVSIGVHVTLTIVEADPAVPGQTAATSCKPAVLENGLRILAPPFIGGGEVTFLRRAD